MINKSDALCSDECPVGCVTLRTIFCPCGARAAVSKAKILKVGSKFGYTWREAKQFTEALIHADMFPTIPERIGMFIVEPKDNHIMITAKAMVKGPVIVTIPK